MPNKAGEHLPRAYLGDKIFRLSKLLLAVLNCGIDAGIFTAMGTQRKVAVHMPEDLVGRALDSSGKGLTATVKQGLELVAAGMAYHNLRKLRGKVRFSIDLQQLREDRRLWLPPKTIGIS